MGINQSYELEIAKTFGVWKIIQISFLLYVETHLPHPKLRVMVKWSKTKHNIPKKIPKSYILYKNDQIQYLYLSSAFK